MKVERVHKMLIGLVAVAVILLAKLFSIQILQDK